VIASHRSEREDTSPKVRRGCVTLQSLHNLAPCYALRMAEAEHTLQGAGKPGLRNSTTVFLVGNIEPTMDWYRRLGFQSQYYPPGFAILRRDDVEIFLQQQPGYVAPDDPGRREREAWNVYIVTDNVKALYEEFSALPDVTISRPLCPQDYGMLEFDVMDLNGHRLVFAEPIAAK
jgi:hypothetical protein